MQYVLLAYGDEKQLAAMSAGEHDALADACRANDAALRNSGRLLAAQGLQSSRAAVTVRVHNGSVAVGGGPCSAANEHLIGIFLIDARDLNEAIQVAATMPQARAGLIEVRPVNENAA